MAAKTYPQKADRGGTYSLMVRYKNADGTYRDFSGYTVTLVLLPRAFETLEPIATYEGAGGIEPFFTTTVNSSVSTSISSNYEGYAVISGIIEVPTGGATYDVQAYLPMYSTEAGTCAGYIYYGDDPFTADATKKRYWRLSGDGAIYGQSIVATPRFFVTLAAGTQTIAIYAYKDGGSITVYLQTPNYLTVSRVA